MNPTTPDSAGAPRPWLPAPLGVIVATVTPTTLDTVEAPTPVRQHQRQQSTHTVRKTTRARARGSGERSEVPTEDQRRRRSEGPTCVGYGATYGKPEEGPLITNLNAATIERLSPVWLCETSDCSPPASSVHGISQQKCWSRSPSPGDLHFLLQGIFPTQGLNPCLLRWQADSWPLSHLGKPYWIFRIK